MTRVFKMGMDVLFFFGIFLMAVGAVVIYVRAQDVVDEQTRALLHATLAEVRSTKTELIRLHTKTPKTLELTGPIEVILSRAAPAPAPITKGAGANSLLKRSGVVGEQARH